MLLELDRRVELLTRGESLAWKQEHKGRNAEEETPHRAGSLVKYDVSESISSSV